LEKAENRTKLNIVTVLILVALTGIIFTVFQVFYVPHDFDNLGGKHAWVSGSTIKYVNMWLDEGASKLHFTNMEMFPSIETATFDDRGPYVSYPTGVTLMVWTAAKLCGKTHIDVSFLKHFQLLMYGIEGIMLSVLIYVFSRFFLPINEKVRVVISLLVSTIWITMPVNNWFLTNIYWTDMAVILWIIAYLLLECFSEVKDWSKKQKIVIDALKVLVIVAGVLTEYFFCIVVFLGFIFNIFYVWKTSDGKKLQNVFKKSLIYVIPVIIALLIYVWQMSCVSDWVDQLVETFLHRTGVSEAENTSGMFEESFFNAITCDSKTRALLLGLVELQWVITLVVLAVKKKISDLIANKCAISVVIMIIAPVVQLILFGNHSAIHQYSMVKVGLHVVGILLLTMLASYRLFKDNKNGIYLFATSGAVAIICILVAMGYPGRIKSFYEEKNRLLDYSIDEAIYENVNYEDVCFSYTYQIPNNPPMDICVAEKMVYIIQDESEMNTMFPNLPDNARKVLVIDKAGKGSNAYGNIEKNEEISLLEEQAVSDGKIIYEDEKCILVRMP